MEKKKVKEERKINLLKIFYLNGGEKFSLIFRWWTLPILFYLPRHFSKEKFYSEFHLSEFHSYRYFFHLSKENSNVHTNVYTGSITRKLLRSYIKLVVRGIKDTISNNYLHIYIYYNTEKNYSKLYLRQRKLDELPKEKKKILLPFFPLLSTDRMERGRIKRET